MIFALFSHSCSPFAEEMFLNIFATPWTIAHWAFLFMGFSGREYWSGLPFSSPGDLPHLGIEPRSPALQADSLLSESPGKPQISGEGVTKLTFLKVLGSAVSSYEREQSIVSQNKVYKLHSSFIKRIFPFLGIGISFMLVCF